MIRPLLFTIAAVALVAPVRAAEPDLSGNWLLTYVLGRGPERVLYIVKVEMKDGKAVISTVFPNTPATKAAEGLEVKDGVVRFHMDKNAFEGRIGRDGGVLGTLSLNGLSYRARLTKTDKSKLAQDELTLKPDLPVVVEAQALTKAADTLRLQIARERDADKKKELNQKADQIQKDLDEKLHEVVAKHGDTVYALDAAMDLLRGAGKTKVKTEEVGKLVAVVEKAAEPYGHRYSAQLALAVVELPPFQKEYAAIALPLAEKLYRGLTPADSLERRSAILSAYRAVLEGSANDPARLKAVSAELAKVETALDADYLKKVPPFKPVAYAGRKEKGANQVAVMELFTGAQCPPCVAADVAFDALEKAYKPTDLVLIQYHLHIPGPDPLTNPDTVARAAYYGARSTPSTFFNGKSLAGGGGPMANAERKFNQYAGIIDPLLEKTSDVKVSGKADRVGDKVNLVVEVVGAEGDDMKLRLLLVEEAVRYTGGNGLRFHHQVVRAMPAGTEGAAINDKEFKFGTKLDLNIVRKKLTTYLDDFATNSRPFPKPNRPMDMKNLRVIALVQNDKTKEIVQAVQIEVEGKPGDGE